MFNFQTIDNDINLSDRPFRKESNNKRIEPTNNVEYEYNTSILYIHHQWEHM
jgi:hypothetical protein